MVVQLFAAVHLFGECLEDAQGCVLSVGDGIEQALAIGKGWALPGAAKDAIANVIPSEEALTAMLEDLPIDITDIEIGNGKLIFEGIKSATGPVI